MKVEGNPCKNCGGTSWYVYPRGDYDTKCSTCVGTARKKRYFSNPNRRDANRTYRAKPGKREKILLASAKSNGKLHGVPFDLELSDIKIPEFCPLLGLKLDPGAPDRAHNLPSLDKIIPELGYVKGNVHVISWRANKLKSNATFDEIHRMSAGLKKLVNNANTRRLLQKYGPKT